MSIPPPLSDACPQCLPGDHPAVAPLAVEPDGQSLRGTYKHGACGNEWFCWWNPEAVNWPLRRDPEPFGDAA